LTTWRTATKATFSDKDFLKKKDKVLGAYPVVVGDAAGTALKAATALGKAEKGYIKSFVKQRYNLDLNI
jgi:hypothetical protein